MSKHFTPGPWVADGPPSNIHVLEAERPHMRICFMTSDGACMENAKLISAAPDLLLALQQLHDDTAEYCRLNNLCGWDNQVMQIARAAIEKATGETVPVPEGQMRHRRNSST